MENQDTWRTTDLCTASLNHFDLCKWQFQLKIIFGSFKNNQANFPLKILIDCNFYQVSPSSSIFAEAASIPNKFNSSYLTNISSLLLTQGGRLCLQQPKQYLYIFFLEFYNASHGHYSTSEHHLKQERNQNGENMNHSFLLCDFKASTHSKDSQRSKLKIVFLHNFSSRERKS